MLADIVLEVNMIVISFLLSILNIDCRHVNCDNNSCYWAFCKQTIFIVDIIPLPCFCVILSSKRITNLTSSNNYHKWLSIYSSTKIKLQCERCLQIEHTVMVFQIKCAQLGLALWPKVISESIWLRTTITNIIIIYCDFFFSFQMPCRP